MTRRGFDGLTIVGLSFLLFLGFCLFNDLGSSTSVAQGAGIASLAPPADAMSLYGIQEGEALGGLEGALAEIPAPVENNPAEGDPGAFTSPYKKYKITQGLHGFSYGHMAIDLAAGKGATVQSPIHGTVTELYVDQFGNPTLVIENEFYRVTMLHGDYTVSPGEQVSLGQPVGSESNHGYTTDMQGVPCRGRNCGYHTHLNVFDKRAGSNVNPLDLIER
jgi:murein DD-endopeptidase MepM/ murein hydrolase activator NlpD